MLVASVPEVGEALHSDHAAAHLEAAPPGGVVGGEVLDGILLIFFKHPRISNRDYHSNVDCL